MAQCRTRGEKSGERGLLWREGNVLRRRSFNSWWEIQVNLLFWTRQQCPSLSNCRSHHSLKPSCLRRHSRTSLILRVHASLSSSSGRCWNLGSLLSPSCGACRAALQLAEVDKVRAATALLAASTRRNLHVGNPLALIARNEDVAAFCMLSSACAMRVVSLDVELGF